MKIHSLKGKKKKAGRSWSDLISLNNWVVGDYYRLVGAVNEFEPHIFRLNDEQVFLLVRNSWFYSLYF